MEVNILNRELKDAYGQNILGDAMFRVVDTMTEKEKRDGIFPHFAGEIFVGEGPATKVVPKYNYTGPGHMLEINIELARKIAELRGKQLIFDLIDEASGIKSSEYEGIWFFSLDKPVQLSICKHIINRLLYGSKTTKAEFEAMEDKEKQEYVDFVYGYLQEKRPYESVQQDLGERVYLNTPEEKS
jgi:hypothetical protein